jgi:hypothetical protein
MSPIVTLQLTKKLEVRINTNTSIQLPTGMHILIPKFKKKSYLTTVDNVLKGLYNTITISFNDFLGTQPGINRRNNIINNDCTDSSQTTCLSSYTYINCSYCNDAMIKT